MARFNLPDINIIDSSVEKIETDTVNLYKELTGTALTVADPRRIFIKTVASPVAQLKALVNYAFKQNLLPFAENEVLDYMGTFTNTDRLEAVPAITTVRFHLSTHIQQTIPAGTRVVAGDGMFFITKVPVPIRADQAYADTEVQCAVAGQKGNGYLPGEINKLVDPIQWVQSVENITTSEGGADIETADSYAERIRYAPEGFSVAGPESAYVYWTKTASQLIVDVFAHRSAPGEVEIRPLLQGGELPGTEMLDKVLAALNNKKIRPLTDKVNVLPPEQVSYTVSLDYWIDAADASLVTNIQQQVNAAVSEYVLWQKSKLGRAIDPSELIRMVKNAGAKRVELSLPEYQAIAAYQVAIDNAANVSYGGLEHD